MHLIATESITDPFTPPVTVEALALALGVPAILPLLREAPGFSLRGLVPLAAPVSGNIATAAGPSTAGLIQVDTGAGDPHDVFLFGTGMFQSGGLRARYRTFLGTWVTQPVPRIVP